MRLKEILLTTAAISVSVVAMAQAMDPASRAMLRREALAERHVALNPGNTSTSFRALTRAKSGAAKMAIPALIQLNGDATAEMLAGDGVEILGQRHGFVFAMLTPAAAERLDIDPSVRTIELNRTRDTKLNLVRETTGVDQVHQGIELPRPYTGKGVVCGVIDAGFDPNHPNFLKEDGTSRFGYFAQVMLNSTGSIIVNKQDAASLRNFTTDDRTTFHGTHTAGIMAGSYRGNAVVAQTTTFPYSENVETECPYYGIAPDAELAASTGTAYDAFIAYAIDSMLEWRWNNRNDSPIVINLSIGGNQGPHDGSSIICQFLDMCAEYDNAIICVAAGNEGDIPLAITKEFTADDLTLSTGFEPFVYKGSENGNIRYGIAEIYSDDDTPFELQAVIYNKARNRVICRMPMSKNVGSSIQYWVSDASYQYGSEDIIDTNFARAFQGYVGVVPTVDPNTGRFYAVVDMYTMDNPDTNADGNYVLGIEITGQEGQRINGYTDGSFISYGSLDIAGWCDGSTDGTISDVACGRNTISVGAINTRCQYPAMDGNTYDFEVFTPGDYTFYSSYATFSDGSTLPHLCAPGAAVISSCSTPYVSNASNYIPESYMQAKVFGDSRDSYYMQMHGTSMATPVVSGTAALMLEANPELSFSQVREILMETAVKDEQYDNLPAKAQAGAGKLDSYAAVKAAAQLNSVNALPVVDKVSRPMVRQTADKMLQITLPGANGINATLYDVAGRKVLSSAIGNGSDIVLDAASLQSGIYILKVNDADAIKIQM